MTALAYILNRGGTRSEDMFFQAELLLEFMRGKKWNPESEPNTFHANSMCVPVSPGGPPSQNAVEDKGEIWPIHPK